MRKALSKRTRSSSIGRSCPDHHPATAGPGPALGDGTNGPDRCRIGAYDPRMAARRTGGVAALAGAATAGYLVLLWLGRTYGSTAAERRAPMPGDRLVDRPQVIATHAATIHAPLDRVWPWLVQVGWHRGGWYTPRWVDALLFPANRPSAQEIMAEYQALAVGDFIPDGAPETECGFVVREVEHGERLLLESRSHLPLAWRRRGLAHLHWTWSFRLSPVDDGRATRLVFRWRARTAPWWLTVGAHLVIVPADFVMSRGMLRGLSRRATSTHAPGTTDAATAVTPPVPCCRAPRGAGGRAPSARSGRLR